MVMYKHIISLGFYCRVAKELERIGLRDASYPFDWIISEWEGVETALCSNFKNFLKKDDLWQFKDSPNCYRNETLKFSFFHDFDKYMTLDEQFDAVKEKYQRRIKRFYYNIQESTLFIRYFKNENEICYWEDNYERIVGFIKQYNSQNDILFINVFSRKANLPNIFYVEPDEKDWLARDLFLEKMPDLKAYLLSDKIYDSVSRKENIRRYLEKVKCANNIYSKSKKKLVRACKKIFLHPYIHFQIVDDKN